MIDNIKTNSSSENNDAVIQVLNQLQSQQAIVVIWEKGLSCKFRSLEWAS